MSKRWLPALLCLAVVAAAVRFGGPGRSEPATAWPEVAPGVHRAPGLPAGYALVAGSRALLIDAPQAVAASALGVKQIDGVLLTHHHRDTCAAAGRFLADKVPVRAPRAAADWLKPDGVARYWREALPLRGSNTAYLVVADGQAGIDCTLEDGQTIDWRGWRIQVVATPGHSRDHVAFAVRRGADGPLTVCCGDALSAPGKLWSPYTTDWDHWTDAGLKPAAASLRKLAALRPALLLPAHGPAIDGDSVAALEKTVAAIEEVAFLKSYERFTKQRLGDAPQYRFLAPEQAGSAGQKPWSQVSEHLFLTGNTWVLTSKEGGGYLVVDPWGQRSADQLAQLQKDRRLTGPEVVLVSHAHFDHYDGLYHMPGREKFQVWALDAVAGPIAEPLRLRAPFLDVRPVRFDRRFQDGDTATWREYKFRFLHLPGQSWYTMGVEATIDGKRCLFTGDNFFHQDLYSGTGGWMGLNRSSPLPYAASARRVLDLAPDWVLAEHGGAFEFNAEDFRRRVRWAEAGVAAADALSASGDHRRDWDPHRVHVEPLVQSARPGATLEAELVVTNPNVNKETLTVTLEGRGLTTNQTWQVEAVGGRTTRQGMRFTLGKAVPAGRQVFALRVEGANGVDGADAFAVVDGGP